jgi:hypothetical protein
MFDEIIDILTNLGVEVTGLQTDRVSTNTCVGLKKFEPLYPKSF